MRAQIRELLVRKLAGDVRIPSTRTVHAVLDRHGLVAHARKRHRNKAEGTDLSHAIVPNGLWRVDFKGEVNLGDGRYCYPLTVTDQASRYLLACEAFSSNKELPVFEVFRRLFAKRRLPGAIRSDNGVPFASPNGLCNLSKVMFYGSGLNEKFERHGSFTDTSLKPFANSLSERSAGSIEGVRCHQPVTACRQNLAMPSPQSRCRSRPTPPSVSAAEPGRRRMRS